MMSQAEMNSGKKLIPKIGWRGLTAWFLTFLFVAAATGYSMSLSPPTIQPDMPSNLRDVFIGTTGMFFFGKGMEWFARRGQ